MNAFELAELTAVLARRGLANRLRIQTDHSILIPKHCIVIIRDNNDRTGATFAEITRPLNDAGYIAYLNRMIPDRHTTPSYRGDTPAQALANLLDDTANETAGSATAKPAHQPD